MSRPISQTQEMKITWHAKTIVESYVRDFHENPSWFHGSFENCLKMGVIMSGLHLATSWKLKRSPTKAEEEFCRSAAREYADFLLRVHTPPPMSGT